MPERRKIMNKQMMNMEELEQVVGGNIFNDAWDWVCDQVEKITTPALPDFVKPYLPPVNDFPNFPIAER